MSVAVVLRWDAVEGVDADSYWRASDALGARDTLPPGCLSHTAAFGEEASVISEVWESAEAFQQFTESKLMPVLGSMGMPPPASVTVLPVVRHQSV